MAYIDRSNTMLHQGLMASGVSKNVRVVPDAVCKVHGVWHRYTCIVPDPDRPVLVCECGDTLWKERPKNA